MSDFFSEIDDIGLLEDHVKDVLSLEEESARKLLRRYGQVKRELKKRLGSLPEETFTEQRLRIVLAQLDAAMIAMDESLKTGMKKAAYDMALTGVDHQVEEIQVFSRRFDAPIGVPIDIDTALVAEETSNYLFNQYEASIRTYSADLREKFASTLRTEVIGGSSYSTVVDKLGEYFDGEEWRLHRIARTEMHNLYSMGKLNGMSEVKDEVLPDLQKTLYQPMDSRTANDSRYVASLKLIKNLDEPFRYRWRGKWRVFMTPPDRPNDRSILIPYRGAWDT